jgi:acyl-CoA thioesterase II
MRIFSPLNMSSSSQNFDRSAPLTHTSHVRVNNDVGLSAAILRSLDDLLLALRLDQVADDRFRVARGSAGLFDRIYGGQLLAQALVGAGATVEGKDAHSLHAAFVKGGTPGRPIEVAVSRVRDGRTMATREVSVFQDDEPLLVAFASFHVNGDQPDVAGAAPHVPPHELPPELQDRGRSWLDQPPPIDLRLPEAPTFLGGTGTSSTRSHWMRLPRPVGDAQLIHAALLAYASDFFLMDMIFRAHPAVSGPGSANAFSVDHAIWFHRPVRFDEWHLHTQQALTIFGDRGLARGDIHDHGGRLVATVMQEVLMRPLLAR